jgi:hypothetical protein
MLIAAKIGVAMFAVGTLAAILGWLPVLVLVGIDGAICTALFGVVALLLGATLWFFCIP